MLNARGDNLRYTSQMNWHSSGRARVQAAASAATAAPRAPLRIPELVQAQWNVAIMQQSMDIVGLREAMEHAASAGSAARAQVLAEQMLRAGRKRGRAEQGTPAAAAPAAPLHRPVDAIPPALGATLQTGAAHLHSGAAMSQPRPATVSPPTQLRPLELAVLQQVQHRALRAASPEPHHVLFVDNGRVRQGAE